MPATEPDAFWAGVAEVASVATVATAGPFPARIGHRFEIGRPPWELRGEWSAISKHFSDRNLSPCSGGADLRLFQRKSGRRPEQLVIWREL